MTARLAGIRLTAALVGVFAACTVTGCISAPAAPPLAVHDLLAGPIAGSADSRCAATAREVLALSDDMKRFVAAEVDLSARAHVRLDQLVGAIFDAGTFGVEYDSVTRPASETFQLRRGNCLSFATMFISMARHAGLDAVYHEVEVPPDWTLADETFVLNQHVNVRVDLGSMGKRVVDFNIGDFRSTYEMRVISDTEAVARYHNNIGVERMQVGDEASAAACFRRAIAAGDPRDPVAWSNLGTLHLRHGDLPRAEAAYLQALRTRPSDLVAMSNLGRLYELTGRHARAAAYRNRVIHHRNRNPYYRYNLALQAYSTQRYDDAIDHLQHAIRSRRKDERFHFLLALSYLQKGNERAARRSMTAAEKLAGAEAKRRYSKKLEALLDRQ